jgi:hypothetical protein
MSRGNSEKLSMNYRWQVKVSARGHLDFLVQDCFEGMEIKDNDDGTTEIEGLLTDLPEVYGFIIRLRDAVVFLHFLEVSRTEIEGTAK